MQHDDELTRLSEQGFDLDDTAELGPYDLDGMRAAIDARVSGGGGPGGATAGSGGVGGLAAAAVALVSIAGAVAMYAASDAPQESPAVPLAVQERVDAAPSPVAAPAVAKPLAPGTAKPEAIGVRDDPAPEPAPAVTPALPVASTPSVGSAPAGEAAPSARSEGVASPTAAAEAASQEAPVPVPAGTAKAPVEAAAQTGDLAAQNEAFALAEAALRRGEHGSAAAAFQDYLARWPDGVFRDDALLSVLELTLKAEQWREAEVLAEQLEGIASLAPRHPEIRSARAEALIRQDRCDLALRLAETMERQPASVVKRSCR